LPGLALLGTIGGGLAGAVRDESHRDAALITCLVTLSGVTPVGIGSAFWGVVAGAVALAIQQVGQKGRGGQGHRACLQDQQTARRPPGLPDIPSVVATATRAGGP